MKNLKRLTAIVLSLVMFFGAIPNMSMEAYAGGKIELKIIANENEVITDEIKYDSVPVNLPYKDKYTATVFVNGNAQDGNTNMPCYPDLSTVEIGVETKVVFGPFKNCPTGYYNISDESNDHYELATVAYNSAKDFYDANKDSDKFGNYMWKDTNEKFFAALKVIVKPSVVIDANVKNGKVFVNNCNPDGGDEVALACIPDSGYVLDSYYFVKDDGSVIDLTGNILTIPGTFDKHIAVGARFVKSNRMLDSYEIETIAKVAEMLKLDKTKLKEFVRALPRTKLQDDINTPIYLNEAAFILEHIRPLYKVFYDLPYQNQVASATPNDMLEYVAEFYQMSTKESSWLPIDISDSEKAEYAKELIGVLILSKLSAIDKADEYNYAALYDTYDSQLSSFVSTIWTDGYDDRDLYELFIDNVNTMIGIACDRLNNYTLSCDDFDETTALYNYICKIDDEHYMDGKQFVNDYERYSIYNSEFFTNMLNTTWTDPLKEKYAELSAISNEEFDKWAVEDYDYDNIIMHDVVNDCYNFPFVLNSFTGLQELLLARASATGTEKENLEFEIAKEEVKIMTRAISELTLLTEATFKGVEAKDRRVIVFMPTKERIADIMEVLETVEDSDTPIVDIHEKLFTKLFYSGSDNLINDVIQNCHVDLSTVEAEYRQIRQNIKNVLLPPSSGSKTYKAKDSKDTAEKISGSGKKGSTRIITPVEGKKVGSVTVTDKNGNPVEVVKNEDGTYSFKQPASDVNVEVTYVNREIKLTIGETAASVDGETSNLDVAPILRNDRTMLPIRFVAENLGAKVEWDEKHPELVVITRGDIKIEITLGSDKAKVNGKEFTLDSVAFAENDRTYLPVRFVSEQLNAIVEWNEARPMEVLIYER